MTFSTEVKRKARKYIDAGRVLQDAERNEVWWVQGADPNVAPYRVSIALDGNEVRGTSCTCPYGSRVGAPVSACAHAAASLYLLRQQKAQKGSQQA